MSSLQEDVTVVKSLIIGVEKRLRRGIDPNSAWRDVQRNLVKGIVASLQDSSKPGSANERLRAIAERLTKGLKIKAAVSPAMTSSPPWAGSLVDSEIYLPALALLSPSSAFAQLAVLGNTVELGRKEMLIPNAQVEDEPLSIFVGEGAPIAARSQFLSNKKLVPFKGGLISIVTDEMLRRTEATVLSIVGRLLEVDIKRGVDKVLLGAAAADAVQPEGLLHNAVAVTASTSTDSAVASAADVAALIAGLTSPAAPEKPVLLASPARKVLLEMLHPGLAVPIIGSEFIGETVLAAVDASEFFVGGNPSSFAVDVTTSAVVHEDSTPLQIVDGSAIAASPSRSLFQTACTGCMLLEDVSWLLLKPAAQITDVAW